MDSTMTSSYTGNTPKRVSFGSTHGSMVETLIIDDIPQEEKNFYRQNIMNNTPVLTSSIKDKVNGDVNTASSDNPFTQDGELAKKAEYILRHSTISRSEIRISDPDISKLGAGDNEIVPNEAIVAQSAAPAYASSPNEIKGQNGKTVSPQNVEVEVGSANASQPQPQTAEQVKVKDKPKCKCCVIQ